MPLPARESPLAGITPSLSRNSEGHLSRWVEAITRPWLHCQAQTAPGFDRRAYATAACAAAAYATAACAAAAYD